eukprot:scaffold214108_cov28-Tisochrysis_lutea.AAC.3
MRGEVGTPGTARPSDRTTGSHVDLGAEHCRSSLVLSLFISEIRGMRSEGMSYSSPRSRSSRKRRISSDGVYNC